MASVQCSRCGATKVERPEGARVRVARFVRPHRRQRVRANARALSEQRAVRRPGRLPALASPDHVLDLLDLSGTTKPLGVDAVTAARIDRAVRALPQRWYP